MLCAAGKDWPVSCYQCYSKRMNISHKRVASAQFCRKNSFDIYFMLALRYKNNSVYFLWIAIKIVFIEKVLVWQKLI